MSKSKKQPDVINTMEKAEAAMGRIDEIDRELGATALAEANRIAEVKANFSKIALKCGHASMVQERKQLESQLKKFAKKERKNWKGKQTAETKFGKFGFHSGQPKLALIRSICNSWEEFLETLKTQEWGQNFIRTQEEPNKEAIHEDIKTDPEPWKALGVEVKKKETFSVTTAASLALQENLKKVKEG